MPVRLSKLIILTIALLLLVNWGKTAFSFQQDYDHEAIQYEKGAVNDPVWRLQEQLNSGKAKLTYDEQFGWLRSVLQSLNIQTNSQILNFGKTSFQAPLISPRRPRALYFNDSVSVGFVRGGEVLEIASEDPKQGIIFYTLDQERSARPRFQRRDACLQCHLNTSTLNVPGLLIRSIYPEPSGMPLFHAGGFVTDHRSPLKDRWGGWYVTGTHGAQQHMGNAFARDPQKPTDLDTRESQNLVSLKGRFNVEEYLSASSDIVALMVIEHQSRATNLLTKSSQPMGTW